MKNPPQLTLEDFQYDLPKELIAQFPLGNRNQNRLLIRYFNGKLVHGEMQNLLAALPQNSLVIVNDTKVIPARIKGNLGSRGKFELMLLNPVDSQETVWNAIGRPMKKFLKGQILKLEQEMSVEIVGQNKDLTPTLTLSFNCSKNKLFEWLASHGQVPLPPYIKRNPHELGIDSLDKQRYQTVYASLEGSVAAPTAGLHFNEDLLTQMREKGIVISPITHHIGAGTFLPVKSQNISEHEMHTERYRIPKSTSRLIKDYKKEKKPIIAIGTTTFRCLEDHYSLPIDDQNNDWHSTDLFIYPKARGDRYSPKVPDALMTNFHQPCSTLFMLICALIGSSETKKLYNEALIKRYRFLSYGDTSLLWLKPSQA